jgi:nucleotide-binding universal stress UspA family protein
MFWRRSGAPKGTWKALCRAEDELVGRRRSRPDPPPGLPRFHRVVVCVDDSPATAEALRWAVALGRLGAETWIVSVGTDLEHNDPLADEMFLEQMAYPDAVLHEADRFLLDQGTHAVRQVLRGPPPLAISRFLAEVQADLVILGSHGHAHGDYEGMGGVAQGIKTLAPCSILVARSSPGMGDILVGTDGSDPAHAALAAGFALGRSLGRPVSILHAAEVRPDPTPQPVEPEIPGLEGQARRLVGPAMHAILEAVAPEPKSLLVLGSRGRTGGPLHSLGSVSDQLLARAPCSVLIVR